jgi:Na+/H+ antiporter NhaB
MLHNAAAALRAQSSIVVMCTALLELADIHSMERAFKHVQQLAATLVAFDAGRRKDWSSVVS